VNGPPELRLTTDTVSRGSREKQPRAFDEGRRVPVLGENDTLVDVCTPDRLGAYLAAPNVEVKRRTDGSIKLVRLRSMGDDRGHQGECHRGSIISDEHVRNDGRLLVRSHLNLKHEESFSTRRRLPGNCAWYGPRRYRIGKQITYAEKDLRCWMNSQASPADGQPTTGDEP
jgi:hypothetical protein